MITFDNDEVELLENSIENIYIEENVTVQSQELKDKYGVFSKTFKAGISININEQIGYEKTREWAKVQVRNYLSRQYQEAIRGYKKQAPNS